MDFYLVTKIQEIRRNPNQYISEVTLFYNLFRLPPDSIVNLNHFKMVGDKFMNFTRVLFSDLDFDILWVMASFLTV